jgi:dihydrofolate reductase
MRKVILGVAVSLDGFIEGPNGEYDWCMTDQDYGLADFFKRIDSIFMGRKSYDLSKTLDPGQNPWKGVKTYVFSNSLKEINDADNVLVKGDTRKEVLKLKEAPGKDIWLFGGAELTTFFVNEELVDEMWLAVHPILLGSGKSLFQKIEGRKKLKLAQHKVYDTGLVSLLYTPDGKK